MTEQERTQALFKLRELMRADDEIRLMANAVANPHGGLVQLIMDDPDTFDILWEEVQSILEQLGVEEAPL